jgi:extracellular factor (EF) 3-hydroxypalmitic acid methyl ester biosynthesis protein
MENQLSSVFVRLTGEFKKYLLSVKKVLDDFDKKFSDEQKQIDFIGKNKLNIFRKLDFYFNQFDNFFSQFDKESLKTFQDFFRVELLPILSKPEINNYIFTKPLGYAGDYIMMNFIYDYYNKFYGKTSFYKLINFYTCFIPVSQSNLKREEYIKSILKEHFKNKENRISSIGCGPARELIELLREGVENHEITFNLFDFEKRAIDFIKQELNKIKKKIPEKLKINFINEHVINIFLKKELKEKLNNQNLIYCIGVFDYLSSRISQRLVKSLYNLLAHHGKLIICNISLEKSSHRSYYEFLGGWEMFHRSEQELLFWAERLKITKDYFEIRNLPGDSYNYLIVTKK